MSDRYQLERAIQALELQRKLLGDAVVDASIAALQEQLEALAESPPVNHPSMITPAATALVGSGLSDTAAFIYAVQHNGGQLIEDAPESLVAVFLTSEEDVAQAIWSALEFMEVGSFGLHTEIVHQVSSVDWTNTVRVARLAQAQASPAGICLSQTTYHFVRGVFNVAPLEPITVGGQPLPLYQVMRAKPRAFRIRPHTIAGIETQMVGRETALQYLKDAYQRAYREQRGQMVTIVGIPGVGKSRLLYEFEKWAELLPEDFWHFEGRATPETNRTPYSLFRQIVYHRFAIHEHDDPNVARQKLVDGITEIMGEGCLEQAQLIGHLIGLDFSSSPYVWGLRSDIRELAFEAVAQWIMLATQLDGIAAIFHLEDLHWADTGSLDLLTYLIDYCHDKAVLVVGTAEPSLFDYYPTWPANIDAHQIVELRSLSEAEARALVAEILKQLDAVPSRLVDEVVRHAAGSPYHIEEAVKLLIDEGVINTSTDWQLDHEALSRFQMPTTLNGVIQARIFALPPAPRVILQRAAIVGRIFWDQAVNHLNSTSEFQVGDILHALQILQQRDFIAPREYSSFLDAHEFMFRQELLQQVAYDSVRQQVRQRAHVRLAQWLIGRSMSHQASYAHLVAQQFARAGEVKRAVKWYGLAARQAQDALSPELSIQYYEQAIGLLPDTPEDTALQMSLYEGLGEVLALQSRTQDAISAYTAVCIAAERLSDWVVLARAWVALSRLQLELDEIQDALAASEQAVQIGKQANDPAILAEGWLGMGAVHIALGQPAQTHIWSQQALELARQYDLKSQQAQALNQMGVAYVLLHQYQRGEVCFTEALTLLAHNDYTLQARILNNLAEVARRYGDHSTSLGLLERALTIARETNARRSVIAYTSNYAGALVYLGKVELAERYLRQVTQVIGNQGWWGMVGTLRYLAEAYIGLERYEEARTAALNCLEAAKRTGNPRDLGVAWMVLGEVAGHITCHVDDQDLTPAQCFRTSQHILKTHQADGELIETLQHWAAYEQRTGGSQVEALRQQAREYATQLGIVLMMENNQA